MWENLLQHHNTETVICNAQRGMSMLVGKPLTKIYLTHIAIIHIKQTEINISKTYVYNE